MSRLLERKDLTKILGLSLPSVDRLLAREDFPKIRFGRSVRVPEELLMQWVEAHVGEAVTLK